MAAVSLPARVCRGRGPVPAPPVQGGFAEGGGGAGQGGGQGVQGGAGHAGDGGVSEPGQVRAGPGRPPGRGCGRGGGGGGGGGGAGGGGVVVPRPVPVGGARGGGALWAFAIFAPGGEGAG